jgi:hypothetical protein
MYRLFVSGELFCFQTVVLRCRLLSLRINVLKYFTMKRNHCAVVFKIFDISRGHSKNITQIKKHETYK